MRWRISASLIGLVVAACSSYTDMASVSPSDPTFTTVGAAIEDSLDEIATVFEGAESADLTMAWSDLDADLRSVVRDVARDPSSVDLAGVRVRVEGFVTRFQSEALMGHVDGQWDEVLSRLGEMADRAESVSSTPHRVAG